MLRDLHARMQRLEQDRSPFTRGRVRESGVHWVRPELVAQIGFTEWTRDGLLRHPRFTGLRSDKKAATSCARADAGARGVRCGSTDGNEKGPSVADKADRDELQQRLRDVEAQIAEQRENADRLRAQVGGQDGAQDAEDVAAALTNIEEIEGVLNALMQRRETVLGQLGENG